MLTTLTPRLLCQDNSFSIFSVELAVLSSSCYNERRMIDLFGWFDSIRLPEHITLLLNSMLECFRRLTALFRPDLFPVTTGDRTRHWRLTLEGQRLRPVGIRLRAPRRGISAVFELRHAETGNSSLPTAATAVKLPACALKFTETLSQQSWPPLAHGISSSSRPRLRLPFLFGNLRSDHLQIARNGQLVLHAN